MTLEGLVTDQRMPMDREWSFSSSFVGLCAKVPFP